MEAGWGTRDSQRDLGKGCVCSILLRDFGEELYGERNSQEGKSEGAFNSVPCLALDLAPCMYFLLIFLFITVLDVFNCADLDLVIIEKGIHFYKSPLYRSSIVINQ